MQAMKSISEVKFWSNSLVDTRAYRVNNCEEWSLTLPGCRVSLGISGIQVLATAASEVVPSLFVWGVVGVYPFGSMLVR